MQEKLQCIIDQTITGPEAIAILRTAIEDSAAASYKSSELSYLIGQAEDVLLYGKEGRPINRSYR